MKNSPIIFTLFGSDYFAKAIHQDLGYELGEITPHQFPDGETCIQIDSAVHDRDVIFVAYLDKPNSKLLPLIFAAETAKALGCKKVGLIAPYLPYMRQDKVFNAGEGVTSSYFAQLISTYFDGLLTIDPHLHRWHALSDLYTIPARALHAPAAIADWIKSNITNPVLIGPDAESSQWVAECARKINAPFLILEKIRKGDRQVEETMPDVALYKDCTPILVDDIISTAATMIETVIHLKKLKMKAPICIGVHALFAGNAYADLLKAGADKIITCNTVSHHSNGIDMKDIIIQATKALFIGLPQCG